MLANRQNDDPVPNRVTSPSESIDPRPNAVIGRSSHTRREQTFGKVSGIEDEADEIRDGKTGSSES
jgi:hypothetical protein